VAVPLFLQGACGNTHHADPRRVRPEKSMEEIGKTLADDAMKAVEKMKFTNKLELAARSRTLEIPYRAWTEADVKGTAKGAQRFGEAGFYDKTMPALLERIKRDGHEKAEVQALHLGDRAFVAIPAEYFVQLGLRIKEECHPKRAIVCAYANGMLGYVPHKEAFARGGYETTFGFRSKMAVEAGDLLADAAIALVRGK
jgi:hypothetical protein